MQPPRACRGNEAVGSVIGIQPGLVSAFYCLFLTSPLPQVFNRAHVRRRSCYLRVFLCAASSVQRNVCKMKKKKTTRRRLKSELGLLACDDGNWLIGLFSALICFLLPQDSSERPLQRAWSCLVLTLGLWQPFQFTGC